MTSGHESHLYDLEESEDGSTTSSGGTATPTFPAAMNEGGFRPKKNVKWSLGHDSEDQTPPDAGSVERENGPTKYRQALHSYESSPPKDGTTEGHSRGHNRHDDEELRNSVHRMFSSDRPLRTDTPQRPALGRFLSEQPQRPRPKSALRSGSSTPIVTGTCRSLLLASSSISVLCMLVLPSHGSRYSIGLL